MIVPWFSDQAAAHLKAQLSGDEERILTGNGGMTCAVTKNLVHLCFGARENGREPQTWLFAVYIEYWIILPSI